LKATRGWVILEFIISGTLILFSFFIIYELLWEQTLRNQSLYRELRLDRQKMLQTPGLGD